MKAGPLFFGSACERTDAAGSCCGLQRPDLGVPQRAKSMSWTGLPGAAEVWNSGRVSKEDFCGRKGRTRGSQPGVGRGLLQKKKSDQKHVSHNAGPILGLWVNSGASWIRFHLLATARQDQPNWKRGAVRWSLSHIPEIKFDSL